jgi:hypothetical protein
MGDRPAKSGERSKSRFIEPYCLSIRPDLRECGNLHACVPFDTELASPVSPCCVLDACRLSRPRRSVQPRGVRMKFPSEVDPDLPIDVTAVAQQLERKHRYRTAWAIALSVAALLLSLVAIVVQVATSGIAVSFKAGL